VCDADGMWSAAGPELEEERTMRRLMLAFLDEYCRGLTLQDVRQWYADAFSEPLAVLAPGEGGAS
jgi:hypothetical protein